MCLVNYFALSSRAHIICREIHSLIYPILYSLLLSLSQKIMFKISVGMGLIRDVVVLLIGIVIGIGIVSNTPSPSLVQQNVNDGQVNVLGLDELVRV